MARLTALAEHAGIRVLRCTYANSLLLPVALAKFRIWEPLTRQAPSSGVEPVAPWLDRMLYGALAAEAAWIGAGHNFPDRAVADSDRGEEGVTEAPKFPVAQRLLSGIQRRAVAARADGEDIRRCWRSTWRTTK